MLRNILIGIIAVALAYILILKYQVSSAGRKIEKAETELVIEKANSEVKTFEVKQKTIFDMKKGAPYEEIPSSNGIHTLDLSD